MDNSKANSIWGRVVFFVFLAIILMAFYYFTRPEKTTITEQTDGNIQTIGGQIAYVQGTVEYKSSDGIWKRASTETMLTEGDSVEVLGEGRVIINLDDGSAIRLNSDSAITLTSLVADNYVVNNDKGHIYARVVPLNNRTFSIKADNVSYNALGTAYKVINSEKIKGVEVYENTVKVIGVTDDEIAVKQGSKYYVKNDANKKSEKMVVEITNSDKDAFVKWNLEQDKLTQESPSAQTTTEVEPAPIKVAVEVKPEVKPVAKPGNTVNSISLKSLGSGKVSWIISGYSDLGFKVVWSKNPHPTYPLRSGDKYNYLSNPDANSSAIDAFSGYGTYYVRVCEYLGGKCGVYSNEISVNMAQADTRVSKIILSSSGQSAITWAVTGKSEQGYKVVWSKNAGPTYPVRDGDTYLYFSDPTVSTANLSAFNGEGLYYVRVCEYVGGSCGVYSNEIKVTL